MCLLVMRSYTTTMPSQLPADVHVYFGDVKNMYTNIEHTNLISVIDWVIGKVHTFFPNREVFVPRSKTKAPSWHQFRNPANLGITLSLGEMRRILTFDIENLYFGLGNKILKQTLGVPMGSPCSPALAVAVCMHAEHHFMQDHPDMEVIAGFRYIDDLLLYLAKPCEDIKTMYPPPLELEEEDTRCKEQGPKLHMFRFLEAWTEIAHSSLSGEASVSITHCLKSWLREKEGKRPLKNITPFDTHVPYHQLFGYAVGALNRAWEQSAGLENRTIASLRSLHALKEHGMTDNIAKSAIIRMHRKTRHGAWLEAVAPLFFLNHRKGSQP